MVVDGYSLEPATGYRLPATGYRLPATGYRLPATGYRAPTSRSPELHRYAEAILLMIFAPNFAWGEKGR
jgi:hypothetical protein